MVTPGICLKEFVFCTDVFTEVLWEVGKQAQIPFFCLCRNFHYIQFIQWHFHVCCHCDDALFPQTWTGSCPNLFWFTKKNNKEFSSNFSFFKQVIEKVQNHIFWVAKQKTCGSLFDLTVPHCTSFYLCFCLLCFSAKVFLGGVSQEIVSLCKRGFCFSFWEREKNICFFQLDTFATSFGNVVSAWWTFREFLLFLTKLAFSHGIFFFWRRDWGPGYHALVFHWAYFAHFCACVGARKAFFRVQSFFNFCRQNFK